MKLVITFLLLSLALVACPQLTSVLREVKYLGMLKNQNISKAALSLYSKRERLYMVGSQASSVALNIVTDRIIRV